MPPGCEPGVFAGNTDAAALSGEKDRSSYYEFPHVRRPRFHGWRGSVRNPVLSPQHRFYAGRIVEIYVFFVEIITKWQAKVRGRPPTLTPLKPPKIWRELSVFSLNH
jgi:hypothetical protein